LLRAVNAYVRDGFLYETVLRRAGRRDTDDRLPAIAAGIKAQTRKLRCKKSATGSRRCGNGRRVGGTAGSPRR
jgi:hypothetical protein